ncbi:MAG: hypothetical protein ACR2LK_13615 [Solirubrobacteraceae bacterium]
MGGTRAVIASLGASMSLVAGAALSLLAASFIFAYDGIVGSVESSSARASLRVDAADPQGGANGASATASATPTLVVESPGPVAKTVPEKTVREQTLPARPTPPVTGASERPAPSAAAPQPKPQAPVRIPKRKAGDGAADGVRGTGDKLGAATAPLSPPVSQAVEKVLDVTATVVEEAVNGLAGVLDATLSR